LKFTVRTPEEADNAIHVHTRIDEGLQWQEGLETEIQATLEVWLEESIRSGVNLQGSRLRPTSDATTVRVRHKEVVVTDGPFAESKEQLAGYDVIECENVDEALAWAAKHPTALIGSIEVRPLFGDPPRMQLPEQKATTLRYLLVVTVDESVELSAEEQPAWVQQPKTGWPKQKRRVLVSTGAVWNRRARPRLCEC